MEILQKEPQYQESSNLKEVNYIKLMYLDEDLQQNITIERK
jgi:hypothetical protein